MNNDLVAAILDNDCAPENPYGLNLHCCTLWFEWKKITPGFWNEDETIWTPSQYEIGPIAVTHWAV